MDEIINKYLNDELTNEEWELLKKWIHESEVNRKTFNQLKSFSLNINQEAADLKEVVWQELNKSLEEVPTSQLKIQKRSYIQPFWLKIAASISVIALITSVFWFGIPEDSDTSKQASKAVTITKEADSGVKITTKLPDGSLVTLNSGSKITFPSVFDKNHREVTLSGEAFFDVVHNAEKPFTVKVHEDKIKVLGTTFNIKSYAEDSIVSVAVATGRVSYTIAEGDRVILRPYEMATRRLNISSISRSKADSISTFGWKDRVLVFNNSSFDEVIKSMERWFGVKITYQQGMALEDTYTEQFDNPTINEVLQSLSFVYRFTYKTENKQITLNPINM